jgi:hypothetical protein
MAHFFVRALSWKRKRLETSPASEVHFPPRELPDFFALEENVRSRAAKILAQACTDFHMIAAK